MWYTKKVIIFIIIFFTQQSILYAVTSIKTYPPDVSFCIVDLKYNKPHVKICEFGQGVVSGFYGHERINQRIPMWSHLWDFLHELAIPAFFIGPRPLDVRANYSKAIEHFVQLGGIAQTDFKSLEKNNYFKEYFKRKTNNAYSFFNPHQAAGVLVSSQHHLIFDYYKTIKKKYPNLLILDEATRPFVLNKLRTHQLFAGDPTLECYRPQCLVVPKIYSPTLAQTIISSITSDYFVIKPINAWKGRGLIFVHRDELDTTLKLILDKNTSTQYPSKAFSYWNKDKNTCFLVESLEHSQPIIVEGHHYDATMRVAFGIAYSKGKIVVRFFDAYWKLPRQSLDNPTSLDETYKSNIRHGEVCSAHVNKQTFKEVTQFLKKILPPLYRKMIAAQNDLTLLSTR